MEHYRNYVFDLYGTLVDISTDENDSVLWRRMAELYSRCGADYSPEALRVAYQRIGDEEREKLRADTGVFYPEIQLETVFLRLYDEAPSKHRCFVSLRAKKDRAMWLQMIAATFRSLSMRRLLLYPRVKDVLTAIRAQGCGIYLLSNAQRLFTVSELEMLGIQDYFDAIYLSSDYGMAKPEAAFFEYLLNEQGLEKKKTVLVGNDWSSDMLIAAKCGVDGIFLNTGHYSEPEIRAGLPKGRFHIIRTGDLSELLN